MVIEAFLFWIIAGLTGACAIATVVTHNIVRSASWLLFTLAGTSGLFFLLGADLVGAIQLLVYVGGTLILVVFGVMLTAQGPFLTMRTSSAEWAISATTGVTLFAVLLLAIYPKFSYGPGAVPPRKDGKLEPLVEFAPKGRLSTDPAKSSYTMVIGQSFSGVGVGPAHLDPNHRTAPVLQPGSSAEPPPTDADPTKVGVTPPKEGPGEKREAEPVKDEPMKDVKEDAELIRVAPMRGDGKELEFTRGVQRTHYLLPFEIVSVHLLVVLIGAAYLARTKRRLTANNRTAGRGEKP